MVASRLFASEGAAIVLSDVADDAGEAVAAEIETAGGQALYVHADV
jgi:NAD(P)-dependent dehydrogenase (short-subunit alcohol dehydrogenase family)